MSLKIYLIHNNTKCEPLNLFLFPLSSYFSEKNLNFYKFLLYNGKFFFFEKFLIINFEFCTFINYKKALMWNSLFF